VGLITAFFLLDEVHDGDAVASIEVKNLVATPASEEGKDGASDDDPIAILG